MNTKNRRPRENVWGSGFFILRGKKESVACLKTGIFQKGNLLERAVVIAAAGIGSDCGAAADRAAVAAAVCAVLACKIGCAGECAAGIT